MKKIRLFILSGLLMSGFFAARSQMIVTTIAGNGTGGFSVDGTAATACDFYYPSGLFMTSTGNLYMTDDSNGRVRMINTAGIISTIAGSGTIGYSGDGFAATNAQLNTPWKIVQDYAGNIFIADVWNQVIRKINPAGIISTYAGIAGIGAYAGDGGPATAAYLNHPVGLAVDRTGNLFIGDVVNNVIRKVNTAGIISTVAGDYYLAAGFSGDGGQATAAQLNLPYGIAVDTSGNLYIGDAGNNKIRMVNTAGIISTIAGTGTVGYTGDGAAATLAQLSHPMEILLDNVGGMYVCDANNNVVRKINSAGIISTFAGTGAIGFSGDGGPATSAKFYYPTGLAFDLSGNVLIADEYNQRIRKIFPAGSLGLSMSPLPGEISVYPNPANGVFSLKSETALNNATVEVYNMLGAKVYSALMNGQQMEISLTQPAGLYTLYLNSGNTVYRQKISMINE